MTLDINLLKQVEILLDEIDSKKLFLENLEKEYQEVDLNCQNQEKVAHTKAIEDVKNNLTNSLHKSQIQELRQEEDEYKRSLYQSVNQAVENYLRSDNFSSYIEKVYNKLSQKNTVEIEVDEKYLSLLPSSLIDKRKIKKDVLRLVCEDLIYDFSPSKLKPELVKKVVAQNLVK